MLARPGVSDILGRMAIQFDIEDIIGAGCLTSIGRALSALACLWLGAATGIIGFAAGAVGAEVIQGGTVDVLEVAQGVLITCAFGPLVMLGSPYILCFFPLVIMVYFTFVRGEEATLTKWVIFASVTGVLTLMSMRTRVEPDLLTTSLAFAMWLGLCGSLGVGAFLLVAWQRRRLTQHLIALAVENDERRRSVAEEFGTAVGDREFATGDGHLIPPPPDVPVPRPEPPGPMRENEKRE